MIPSHLAIIMDGNRRFARHLMKSPWMGHEYGLKKSREVLEWACEAGIRYMTAYTLSLENITSRPKKELAIILKYIEEEADTILTDAAHSIHRFRVRVRFIGRTHILPEGLQKKMRRVEERTCQYRNHVLNIAVAYGGQQELVDAVKQILEKGLRGVIRPSDLNEEIIKEHLYTNGQPYPDLIIRTGGEQRLSNFLPYQSVYAELIFTDKKWPEVTRKDFQNALKEFDRRKRRFGK
ncbi:MAG: di-trans,poly-cis-decaprenylcistransferase [Candidatus Aenigmarchaeota archaeon]|nr:di-trans,poly-cis-decaprenylcistransferase [Candidatus Aenigmarchaeota archaeon]